MYQNKPFLVSHFNPELRQKILPQAPLLSTNGLALNGINFNYFYCSGENTPTHITKHHVISVSYGKSKSTRKLNGIFQNEHQNYASLGIIPAKIEHCCIWQENIGFALFSIQPQILAQTAPETINPDKIELIPKFIDSKPDNLIASIGMAMKQQLEIDPNGCGFYLEHLFTALSAHLVKNYCSLTPLFKQYGDGLPPYKLKQAINYINDNLDQPIKLNDIAKILDLSQYYFCHMFKESTGVAPYKYVIKQRVEKAKNLIKNSQLSLADIAYECGFSSQSQMTQHFRKCVGVTPRVYSLKCQ